MVHFSEKGVINHTAKHCIKENIGMFFFINEESLDTPLFWPTVGEIALLLLASCTSFLITHLLYSCATLQNKLIVLIAVIHQERSDQTFFPSLPLLSCMQKNIVHRDLKLGNMVLNKR